MSYNMSSRHPADSSNKHIVWHDTSFKCESQDKQFLFLFFFFLQHSLPIHALLPSISPSFSQPSAVSGQVYFYFLFYSTQSFIRLDRDPTTASSRHLIVWPFRRVHSGNLWCQCSCERAIQCHDDRTLHPVATPSDTLALSVHIFITQSMPCVD